jgi:hypothetical protein
MILVEFRIMIMFFKVLPIARPKRGKEFIGECGVGFQSDSRDKTRFSRGFAGGLLFRCSIPTSEGEIVPGREIKSIYINRKGCMLLTLSRQFQ